MSEDKTTRDDEMRISVEDAAQEADLPPWRVARGLAKLIATGLVKVEDGTAEEAVASLRRIYGEAVNGQ